MKQLLAEARELFDYIVVDLPPLGPVLDARAIGPQIDGFVLVVEWRKTARKIVRNILANNTEIYNKSLGVVLNKVNVSELRLYAEPGSHYRHYAEYAQSYYFEGTKDTRPSGSLIRRWISPNLKKWTL